MTQREKKLLAILLPLLLVWACGKEAPPPTPQPAAAPPSTAAPAPPPVSVAGVTLGSAIGADKRVSSPAESFGAKDTIYVSVETTGVGPASVRGLWTFVKGDKTTKVGESGVTFESTGPAVNEMHVSNPSGWPKGDYRVEVFLGDGAAPVATKAFKVN